MLKPIFGLAATGVVAVLLWKLLAVLLLPLAGMALGFLFVVIKFVFIACAVLVAVWMFRRWTREAPSNG